MVCPDQKKKPKREQEDMVVDDDFRELFDECCKEVNKLDSKIVI
jgi:H/ACA ribonucleoprotein complex subunit 2